MASLEDCPLTNAGLGSNLNEDGQVECDASVMGGDGSYGAAGAVPRVRNVIRLAHALLSQERRGLLPLGRVPPVFLVGEGAARWARAAGLEVAPDDGFDPQRWLVTPESRASWEEHTARLQRLLTQQARAGENGDMDRATEAHYDTVGAICVDSRGRVAAAVSSGGISLKPQGRVGDAAVYGAGCWAADARPPECPCAVAVSTTGVGEVLIKSLFAYQLADALRCEEGRGGAEEAVARAFEASLLRHANPHLAPLPPPSHAAPHPPRLAGAIALRLEFDPARPLLPELELVWAHSTHSMGVGWARAGEAPQALISELARPERAGLTLQLGGTHATLSLRPA